MAMGEVFVSALIKLLVEKMASGELSKFVSQCGIDKKLQKWSKVLSKIQAILADAEEKQVKQRVVKSWLEDLQDLAYDLDDLVDELATEALARKLKTGQSQPSTSKVRKFIPTFNNFHPSSIMFSAKMHFKIDNITTRLNEIFERSLGLELNNIVGTTSGQTWQRPETTSLVYEPYTCGRKEDKRHVIKLLLRDDSSDPSEVDVVALVGMGGIGKTTLAQMVYNNEDVIRHFDVRAWACVSDEFDMMKITKAVLESSTSRKCDFNFLEQVQVELKKTLNGKKFLIVLDDVWNKNLTDLEALMKPFNFGAQGSKVVVTTRNRDVAQMMGAINVFEVKVLSLSDCWSLFAKYAFTNRNIDANPRLVSIGKKIVEKCGCLPLAAKTLGGLLRHKELAEEWEGVLCSNMWNLSKDENDILPTLRLSYHHLPPHLKPCFSYCSILPKDYEFEEKELVLLWMAEGFLEQQSEQRQMEVVGAGYFHELVSRSFFQPSNSGSSRFVMHDLINDLAQDVAGSTCFRLEDIINDKKLHKNLEKARHASYMHDLHYRMNRFEIFYKAKHLRTFMPFSLYKFPVNHVLKCSVPFDLLPNLCYLRELSLRNYAIEEIPDSIGSLKHLRFLDLSCTLIERLPRSLGDLYNLQTLLLGGCLRLSKISIDMGKLTNLLYFDNPPNLCEMPAGIGQLTSLLMLSEFVVTKGSRIKELANLNHLGGVLRMSRLHNIVDAKDAEKAYLKDKKQLVVLHMMFDWFSFNVKRHRPEAEAEAEVLHVLRPHENLKELHIDGFHGTRFPYWMGDPLFSNMESITLKNCGNCTSLPPLGQLPFLKNLYVEEMVAVKQVAREFCGQGCPKPFPLLEELSFQNMPQWEDWQTCEDVIGDQLFSCICKLIVKNCPKLLGTLPGNLPCLKTLMIEECPKLQVEVSKLNCPSLISLSMKAVSFPFSPIDEMGKVLECISHVYLKFEDFLCLNYLSNASRDDELKNIPDKYRHNRNCLEILNFQKLAFWPKCLTEMLKGVESLWITNCDGLLTLGQNNVRPQHHSFQGLEHLNILSGNQLVSLSDEGEDENIGQQLQRLEGLTGLEILKISHCDKLETLTLPWHNFMSLKELHIAQCKNLVSISVYGFACALRKLEIYNCDALQCLSGWGVQNENIGTDSSLEDLIVMGCKSLKSLISSRDGLPLTTLRMLSIVGCENMLAVLEEEEGLVYFPWLECISIYQCESLKSLPNANLQNYNGCNNLGRLTRFDVINCGNLEHIPQAWFTLPINLTNLRIYQCEKLQQKDLFSSVNLTCLKQLLYINGGIEVSWILEKGNFLFNLVELTIGKVKTEMPPSEWGLQRLSSLKKLLLWGPIVIIESDSKEIEVDERWPSFPFDGMRLPISLDFLSIFNFKNLVALSWEFQHLTSLIYLGIKSCPKLASLPKQGLPSSLLALIIEETPKLEKKCKKGKGKYWPLIAFIPQVEIRQSRSTEEEDLPFLFIYQNTK